MDREKTNSLRSNDPFRASFDLVASKNPRHAEIRNLGDHFIVKKYIACLEVPVDDPQS